MTAILIYIVVDWWLENGKFYGIFTLFQYSPISRGWQFSLSCIAVL